MKKSRVSDKENQWPEDKLNNLLSSNDHISMSVNKNVEDTMNEILVEKLRQCLPKHQENYETIKSLLAKLYTRITSSDRKVRERTLETMWSKEYNVIEIFIVLLEACKDNGVCCNITGILHECIAPRQSKVKLKGAKNKHSKSASRTTIAQLIQFGGTQVFLKLLINSQRTDNTMTEILIYEILWILSQIAQKDQKFPIKVRLLNVTKVFNSLLKNNYNDARLLLPLLLILKSLAKNTSAVQILVKDGIASSLEKTFVCIGYSPHLKLKVLLECLKHFTSNRLCCAKFVKGNMVHMLMRVFERWDRWDGQLRQKIANYGLCTLHHLCLIKSGRRALKANNGLQLLYRFCSNCPETKPYDFLLSRVCGIISQCLEKRDLPVPEMSPAKFNLPNGNGKRANSVDSCSDVESQANSVNSAGRICSDADSVDDDDDDDNDDDYSGDQCALNIDKNKLKHFNDVNNADEGQYFASVITSQRTTEDLLGYSVLFRELGNLETQLMMESQSNSEDSIVESVMSKETKRTQLLSDVKSCDSNNWTGVCTQITDVEALPYLRKLRLLDGIPQNAQEKTIYCICASRVRSVISFVKVAYPDLIGGCCRGNPEPLNDKDRKVCRAKLLNSVDRGLRPNLHTQEVIFDLDALSMTCQTPAGGTSSSSSSERLDRLVLGNSDESHTGSRCIETKSLLFESRFESGNLRKVIQIGPQEYDLILTPDVNSGSRHQWFYFQVSNMEANIPYTFNIVNCEKANSQFNFGMKPILFSVTEAQLGRPGWVRTGSDICYYRNCYRRPCRGKNYLTTSFNVTFPHSYDICYLAYHFPYTYSQLMTHIWRWSRLEKESVHFTAEILCNTLNNNECPLLTITSPESTQNPISKRKIIFLTSRVHPGESNSSWVIHGTLEALLADSTYAKSLRDDYIFKIVPMLNIEGVVNGCNRYGLTNEDLNRRWSNPSRVLHPVIYHTKGLMEYCSRVLHRPPHVFVDYHGHSRRKNVFLFGCSRSGSWSAADREKPDQPDHYLMLPRLMQKTSPAFALPLCSFKVERSKESTARVAIWRQLGVARSYTMESSFCGCDQGPLAGLHLDTNHLRNVGRDFCQALAFLKDTTDNWILDKSSTSEECCPLECVKKSVKDPNVSKTNTRINISMPSEETQ
ncbi:cytosolic carboxypeptidase 1-like isoform X1 [Microplitis mediator]|uniref:cytosolic carboxypeptidase 1-like isoform X1 n=3 Tax=Microplitis mediator TaxID=375433 RepID=UPI0025561B53|nr:cytosolic carboxypeptidase 1-like isoform X1 [Microplitis mediator]XP_057320035.1 cytosolic carboxypeptidase 1-like isoform X1 [Microplitis mediator]XP_057320036.1 cytosolic carboxypeptidase 1-like isoform X1 [Microplitis mediator]XP_057320037.1 cytosolic carboxypeptidase 1-like isoform X1 [Microplitis mediator]